MTANLVLTARDEWVVIPDDMGLLLYARNLDELTKGRNHKYIRRVPYVAKNGKTRYRYFYHVRGGKGAGHHDEFKVHRNEDGKVTHGAKFKIKHGEHEGHFEVTDEDGDRVKVRHDESGHETWMSKAALSEMIRKEHADAIGEHHDAVRAEYKAAKVKGVKANIAKRAKRYGVELEPEKKDEGDGKTAKEARTEQAMAEGMAAAARKKKKEGEKPAKKESEKPLSQQRSDLQARFKNIQTEARRLLEEARPSLGEGRGDLEDILESSDPTTNFNRTVRDIEDIVEKLGKQLVGARKKVGEKAPGTSDRAEPKPTKDDNKSFFERMAAGSRRTSETYRTLPGDPNHNFRASQRHLAMSEIYQAAATGDASVVESVVERWKKRFDHKGYKDALGGNSALDDVNRIARGVHKRMGDKPPADEPTPDKPWGVDVSRVRPGDKVEIGYGDPPGSKGIKPGVVMRQSGPDRVMVYRNPPDKHPGRIPPGRIRMVERGDYEHHHGPAAQKVRDAATWGHVTNELGKKVGELRGVRKQLMSAAADASRALSRSGWDAAERAFKSAGKGLEKHWGKVKVTLKRGFEQVREQEDDPRHPNHDRASDLEHALDTHGIDHDWAGAVGAHAFGMHRGTGGFGKIAMRAAASQSRAEGALAATRMTPAQAKAFEGLMANDSWQVVKGGAATFKALEKKGLLKVKMDGKKKSVQLTDTGRRHHAKKHPATAAEPVEAAPKHPRALSSALKAHGLGDEHADAVHSTAQRLMSSMGYSYDKAVKTSVAGHKRRMGKSMRLTLHNPLYRHPGSSEQRLLLFKGRGHKYIRRVPQLNKKTGKMGWRYYYKVTGKKGVGHEDEFVAGAKFKIEHDGELGHFEVDSVDGDKVTVTHDESGKSVTMTKDELTKLLHKHHAEALEEHTGDIVERMKAEAEKLKEFGTEGQKAAWEKRWRKHMERYNWLAGQLAPIFADNNWDGSEEDYVPPESPAVQLHEKLLPPKTVECPNSIKNFSHKDPDRPFMKGLMNHQIDFAERAHTAFDKGHGILLQDDAGLGKTLSAIATIAMDKELNDSKRHLVVVPTQGKHLVANQWNEDGKLYGVELKHAKDHLKDDPNAEGTFWCSYEELYIIKERTVEIVAADGTITHKKEKYTGLRPEFQGKFDTITFDESHKMANPASKASQAGVLLQEQSEKVVYVSATPFTDVVDMHYLRKLGMFETGKEFADWAALSNCNVIPGKMGDIPARIENPTTPMPMVVIAATMHVDGTSLKRTTTCEGMTSKFNTTGLASLEKIPPHILEKAPELANLHADAQDTLDVAAKMFEIARKSYPDASLIKAQEVNWSKTYWETLKVVDAIRMGEDALEKGKQVAFFSSYKEHRNSQLGQVEGKGLAKMLRTKAREFETGEKIGTKGKKKGKVIKTDPDMIDPQRARGMYEAAAKIDQLSAGLPDPVSPIDVLNKYFENSAEIHGNTSKRAIAEQKAYQRGDQKTLIATISKAGTGLSFHDDAGNAARVQINLSIPWTGMEFTQLSGRSHRLGSKSNTVMYWMMSDSDTDKRNAAAVAARLKSMGSLVSGDPDMEPDSAVLASFDRAGGGEMTDEEKAALIKEASGEGQVARDHFRHYAEGRAAGRDMIQEEFDRRQAEKRRTQLRAARKLAYAFRQEGIHLVPHVDDENPDNLQFLAWASEDSSADSKLRAAIKNIRKGRSARQKGYGDYVLDYDALDKLAGNLGIKISGRQKAVHEKVFEASKNPQRLGWTERDAHNRNIELLEYEHHTTKKEKKEKYVHPAMRHRAGDAGYRVDSERPDKAKWADGDKKVPMVKLWAQFDSRPHIIAAIKEAGVDPESAMAGRSRGQLIVPDKIVERALVLKEEAEAEAKKAREEERKEAERVRAEKKHKREESVSSALASDERPAVGDMAWVDEVDWGGNKTGRRNFGKVEYIGTTRYSKDRNDIKVKYTDNRGRTRWAPVIGAYKDQTGHSTEEMYGTA